MQNNYENAFLLNYRAYKLNVKFKMIQVIGNRY